MPNILMQGRWNGGSSGNGHLNNTQGISGVLQTISGSHVAQGRTTGTIVVDESLPVVVSQMLVVIEKSVKAPMDTPGGSVVIVDVTVPLGRAAVGPTVMVEPSVKIVRSPVIAEESEGRVRIVVEPSGSVSVSTIPVRMGPTVSVEPSMVIVSSAVIAEEPEGNFKTMVEPSASVSVSITPDGTGLIVSVTPSVVSVSTPVGAAPPPSPSPSSEPERAELFELEHHASAGGHVGPALPAVAVLAG